MYVDDIDLSHIHLAVLVYLASNGHLVFQMFLQVTIGSYKNVALLCLRYPHSFILVETYVRERVYQLCADVGQDQ